MTAPRFTAGPWSYWPKSAYPNGVVSQDKTATHIAVPVGMPAVAANAHLIAAAPTLYAAPELLLRDIEPMEQAAGVKTASGDAARAALAMARGEAP